MSLKRARAMLMLIDTVRSLQLGIGLAALLAVAGCGEYRVPVGSEGNAVNSGQCLGESTKCSPPLEGDWLDSIDPHLCDSTPVGTFSSTFPVSALASREFAVGADGSAWSLITDRDVDGNDETTIRVEHFDANGERLGSNDNLAQGDTHTLFSGHIAQGPDGGAAVFLYSIYAVTADDALTEHASVIQLDSAANLTGPAIPLSGASEGRVAVGSRGTITVAANASNNAPHGRLLRLAPDGAPIFVQPNVPSNGQGIGTGVTLALHDQGASTVLSERSRTFENRTTTFGIAKYDASGNLTKNWLLPANFDAGTSAAFMSTSDGHLVVGGMTDPSTLVVLVYSTDGEALFGWQVQGFDFDLAVDEATGAVLVYLGPTVLVLSSDGATCKAYSNAGQGQYTQAAGNVTFSDGWTLTRPGLAME